jgi:type IV pilus assembly protein PilY1
MRETLKPRWQSLAAASLAAIITAGSATADDSEIFTGGSSGGVAPNILLIVDDSGSMSSPVTTQNPYDPTHTYTGSCSTTLVYFQASGGSTPTGCSGMSSFSTSYQKCQSATSALTNPGFYTDQFLQWRLKSGKYSWSNTVSTGSGRYDVACQGDYSNSLAPYPTTYNGATNTAANEWTNTKNAANSYWALGGTGTSYTLYSGNYLNYLANPVTVIGTRIQVVQQAATNLINSLSNVNIGLMTYSNNLSAPVNSPADPSNPVDGYAAGGMVTYPVSPVATNRTPLINAVNSLAPGGFTPLSETLYEAYLYYSGGNVLFGNTSQPSPSVAAARVGGTTTSNQYQTPIQYQCQKNFIVYLTDGLPTADNQADSLITALPNEATLGGACDDTTKSPYNGLDASGNPIPGGWDWPGPSGKAGRCMTALAKYMFNADLSSSLAGQQNVTLYTIGFGDDPGLAAASGWLGKAATAGGGQFYQTTDLSGLQTVLTNIVGNILQTSSTFTAPTVSVNAFNRTQTLNDLYVSVFQPSVTYHWPGNVKKYSVQNGVILDQNSAPAVDPTTGFFKGSAQSFWSASADGSKVTAGGAANQIPNWDPSSPSPRNLYTYIGTNKPASPVDLTSSANYAVTTTNPLITNAILGVSTSTGHDNVINYARGEDLKDENANGITNEPRHAMGDPLHSQPAVVIYGGTPASPNINDAAIFAATNDGYLHAFDVSTGRELWAFIPQELLGDLLSVYQNSPTSPKHYELDGSIRILKYDVNGDGIVDPAAGDRVIAYFGNGRGGSMYYAVDVTSKTTPKFLWAIGPTTTGLSGVGQTWSTPAITRVNVKSATQNSQKFVLVFGGGYDTAEEGTSYQASDSSGNWLYMVDALYGTVLWSAGPTGATYPPNLALSSMDHAIPSDVTVLDIDGDGYADRMYVGDMAGQLWRFDIYNGNNANQLVTGGVIASLGTHDDTTHTAAATRRFYYPPDVAAVTRRGTAPYFNIAIGSGYRGHPLNTTIQDRFYAIRDYHPFDKLTQSQYSALTVIRDSDTNLIDITSSVQPTIPAGAEGWKLLLDQPGNSWVGEKVLSTSSTFNNQILFTTYTPNASVSSNPCTAGAGNNRIYAVSVFDGSPVDNLASQSNTSISDRSTALAQGGIAPGVTFLFPAPQAGAGGSMPPPNQDPVTCMSGAEVLGVCHSFNSRVKTVWSEQDAN